MHGVRVGSAPVSAGSDRHAVALELLRTLSDLPGLTATRRCPRCGTFDHGPIEPASGLVLGVAYARRRTGDTVAVAAVGSAATYRALAVDAEFRTDAVRDAAGFAGLLVEPADDPIRGWVRVEDALKADGRGVRLDPATVRVRGDGARWSASLPDGNEFRGWDEDVHPDLHVAVAAMPRA